MVNENEEWRTVPGFVGYFVSSEGRITGRYGRLINPSRRRYLQVVLQCEGIPVTRSLHVLVAAAFLGPRPAGMQVNHIDGNRHNCAAANLEYVTPRQNAAHWRALEAI